ncbi:MAG: transglycosylase SLT domain-containing protein [Gammaproteobacteria bacterium]
MASDNSNTAGLLILLALAAAGVYLLSSGSIGGDGMFCSCWMASGSCYVPTLNQIGAQYGLPNNLLPAVAFQESSFDPSAVNASSGAVGMFQLLPQYYPGAGQSWQTDAATAAQALAGYYQQFGNWQDALAAYNWGPGNLAAVNACSYACLPSETQNYVTSITAATGVTGPLVT